ncbi:lipoprotein [Catenuloplanes indicus]|uniref:Secreted protein n=1 Tax=Catenuloplanes indicus TaxID=137267 RepID=A0AAE3VXA9_9ACTN|nr:lipoprotein [Catenuloplanes indicus]MDQ0365002.1 hypothetical protein [Catenuloplanes indicus]
MRKSLAVLSLMAALSGCASTPPPTADKPATLEQYQLDMAACMREQGVDMPDPQGNAGVALDVSGLDMAAVQAAAQACQQRLGPPPAADGGPGKTGEERLADQLKIAQCLREHGVDAEDPVPGGAMELPADLPEAAAQACGIGGGVQPAMPGKPE